MKSDATINSVTGSHRGATTTLRINSRNFMHIKANCHQVGLPSYLRISGNVPRSCKIITTLGENLAAYIALLLLIFFIISAVQVRTKQKNTVLFFFLSQTCWLPMVILALPQMLLCLCLNQVYRSLIT